MNSDKKNMDPRHNQSPKAASVGSYESTRALEEELPAGNTANPGSPDPTILGQQTDAEALVADPSIGAPDPSFFQDEDSGSDGEPDAGPLGGTQDQFHAEMDRSDAEAARVDPADESPRET